MPRLLTGLALALAVVLLGGPGMAAEPDAAAMALACFGCHGPDGRSRGAIPSIAGLKADVFAARMSAFRASSGDATIMDRIAKGLSDGQIDALAAFLATHEVEP